MNISSTKRQNLNLNYLFIFSAINYLLFARWIFHADSQEYGLIALGIIVVLFNYKDIGRLLSTKPYMFWLIWCIFAVINYHIHDSDTWPITTLSLFKKIFFPLLTMLISAKEYHNNNTKFLWCCIITYLAYMALGYYFDRGILFRKEGFENVLGNMYAITSMFILFFAFLLHKCGKMNSSFLLALVILIMVVLAMSGTRKAFGAGAILLIFWGLSIIDTRKFSTWVIVIFLVWGSWKGYNYLMENTFIGERMEYLEEQQEDFLPSGAPKILSIFGDRAPHYYYGWFQFLESPILGVGLNQSAVQQGFQKVHIHSEYMSQLVENGIVGFLLLFIFYIWIIRNFFSKQKFYHPLHLPMLGGFTCIVFIGLTAWQWEFTPYFVPLGIICSYLHEKHKKT